MAFDAFERTARLQNEDRADALIRVLDKRVKGEVSRIQAAIDRQLEAGKTSLVAANQARIDQLQDRANMRRTRYQKDSKVTPDRALFLMGLIEVLG
jgi:hypothetical protein